MKKKRHFLGLPSPGTSVVIFTLAALDSSGQLSFPLGESFEPFSKPLLATGEG